LEQISIFFKRDPKFQQNSVDSFDWTDRIGRSATTPTSTPTSTKNQKSNSPKLSPDYGIFTETNYDEITEFTEENEPNVIVKAKTDNSQSIFTSLLITSFMLLIVIVYVIRRTV